MNKYNIYFLKSLDENSLKKWQELWDQSQESNFHNSPQWFIAACKSFDIKNYLLVVAEANGRIEAVFPLLWEKRFGIKALCNIGGKFADKSTLLLRKKSPELIGLIFSELSKIGNLYLEELSSDVADMMIGDNKNLIKQQASINPYILLNDPFGQMNSKNRSKMLNKIKNNEKDLSYKHFSGDPKSLEIAFKIDEKSYKYERGTSDIRGKKEREFYKHLLNENKQNFVVDVVYYKGIPFIYSIGFMHKKTFYAGITSYDKKYAFLSPGKLLQYYLLRQLEKEKIEIFDFSRGQNAFKKDFTSFYQIQYDVLFINNLWIKYWWKTADRIYNFIFENKTLYGIYLIFKPLFGFDKKIKP